MYYALQHLAAGSHHAVFLGLYGQKAEYGLISRRGLRLLHCLLFYYEWYYSGAAELISRLYRKA